MKKRLLLQSMLAGAAGSLPGLRRAFAQDAYPSRVVKFIVPFGVGGTTDAMARRLTEGLRVRLGQPVIMENKAGAGGAIGAQAVLNAPPDGYTVLFTSTSLVQAALLTAKPIYDPLRDFIPIAMVCVSPVVLGVPAQLNVKTAKEFIDYLASHKGQTSYASSGPGTTSNIYSEELKRRYGLDSTHVPYQGDAKTLPDLISNRVQFYISTVAGLHPHAKQGSIRLLALTGAERMPSVPELPTFKEQGIDGFETVGWFGVFVAARTPPAIVKLLREEVSRVVQSPDYSAFLNDIKMMPPLKTDFSTEVARTQAAWGEMIKANNIRIE